MTEQVRRFDISEGEEYPVLFVSELAPGQQAYEFLGIGRDVVVHGGWELPGELADRWFAASQEMKAAEVAVSEWWHAAREARFGEG